MGEANNGSQNFRNWLLSVVLVVLGFLAWGSVGFAWEPSLMAFNNTYGTWGTALDTCVLCHPYYPLSSAVNTYGSDFINVTIGDNTFNQALEAKDSDGDGFTNIQEIRALTFPGDGASQPPASPVLQTVSVNGPSTVDEGGTASYEATASWSDGSETVVSADWTVWPDTLASITSAGVLTAVEVATDQNLTVSATFDGMTAEKTVTILDIPEVVPPLPADSISLMPQDGAVDIPITTVVVATMNTAGDIASIVNDNTFSLSVTGPADPNYLADVNCVADGKVRGSVDINDGDTEATFTPLCKLANATMYTATVAPAIGTLQATLAEPVISTFTTIAQTPDSDGDGVEDGEDDHPNDNGRATPPSVRGTGKFLVDTYGNSGIALADVEGISDMYPEFKRQGKPFGFEFPDGLVRYMLRGASPGGTVTVTVSFPSGIPKGSKVFKVDSNGFQEWTNAAISGNRVTVTLTDGGEGDADGIVNGEIVDPIGVAVPTGAAGSTDVSGSGSLGAGCSVAGSDQGWTKAVGSFGLVALVWLGLALRRRKPGTGA